MTARNTRNCKVISKRAMDDSKRIEEKNNPVLLMRGVELESDGDIYGKKNKDK